MCQPILLQGVYAIDAIIDKEFLPHSQPYGKKRWGESTVSTIPTTALVLARYPHLLEGKS